MRKTIKKTRSAKNKEEAVVESIDQSSYINIREINPELQKKRTILKFSVIAFTIFLLICWLIILKINIAKETNKINLDQLGQQIADSLSRFDTEIKSRNKPQEININDLDSIKDNLEEQIKNNPDSSSWPTHEFPTANISLQYPSSWQKISSNKTVTIGDSTSTINIETYGKIIVTLKDNAKKLSLDSWIAQNSDLKNYQPEKSIFIFTSTTPENYSFLKINTSSTISSTLNRVYFINSIGNKKVIEIKTESLGDDTYYKPLMEEIIRTIKLIKP